MTTINYTYEVTRVDPETKSMDITYRSEQYGVMTVGARMPWDGESVEDVVRMFSPVTLWLESEKPTGQVWLGYSGSLSDNVAGTAPGPRSVTKIALVRTMRDVDYDGTLTLWDKCKQMLDTADEQTQEDWLMASNIMEDDPVFVAMATTLFGEEAQARIAAVFDQAGAA